MKRRAGALTRLATLISALASGGCSGGQEPPSPGLITGLLEQ